MFASRFAISSKAITPLAVNYLVLSGDANQDAQYDAFSLTGGGTWQPPVAYPSDGNKYKWDESSVSWVLIS